MPTNIRQRRSTSSSAVQISDEYTYTDDKKENSIHMSLLTRMLALVLSFTCIALVIKNGTRRVTELRSTTGMTSSEAQVELSARGPSFVTVVLPRYVIPRGLFSLRTFSNFSLEP